MDSKKEAEEILNESVEAVNETPKKSTKKSKRSAKTDKKADRIAELEAELEESKDKHLRLYAEFENYKRRTVKERINLMSTAAQDTLSSLLPVLDDFDRAKKSADDETSDEQFSEGVTLVYNKLKTAVQAKGLKVMETNGKPFNPEFHEAITEIPAPSDDMKGKIIDTIESGYLLNDKIIRYAKVVVGK